MTISRTERHQYGLGLLPQHEALLRESAISPDVAEARGYRSIETKADMKRKGFSNAQRNVPGLLVPIYDVAGECATYQFRPDQPRLRDGKPVKYETPTGSRLVLDAPPVVQPSLADSSCPLFITEGARKADAAASIGACCIALMGVWGWRGRNETGGLTALVDWEYIHLKGRPVYLCFDSDVVTKPEVHAALKRLRAFLASRGSDVATIYLPPSEDGRKVGLDDFLASGRSMADLLALATTELKPPAADGSRPAEGTQRFPRTDVGNAELFAQLCGSGLRYDHRRNRWRIWKDHWWVLDADAEVRRLAKAATRKRYQSAASIDDLKEREAEARWAIGSESRMRLDAMMSLAQAERPIADAGDSWDSDPWLLGVGNGVVDLKTDRLRDGRQADRVTMHSPVEYDPDAACPRWEAFVREIFAGDDELADYIWRACGYSLTGITSEQCLFISYGSGWNGKSTFKTVLENVIGDYAANTPFSTLEIAGRYSIPNDVAALQNKRLVTASEVNEGRRLNEARLKALAGEDTMTARFLYGELFTFRPVAKFWLSVNHKPVVGDDSSGFWRKIRLIPFIQSFKGRSDPGLETKLRGEYPGILAWMVRGCLEWQERGLEPPDIVKGATEQYRAESDRLAAFLDEACIAKPAATTKASNLYKRYKLWAEDAGLSDRERLSSTMFGTMMGERFAKRKDRAGWFYYGIAARPPGLHDTESDT